MAVALFALVALAERVACPVESKGTTRMRRPWRCVRWRSRVLAGCGEKEDVLEPSGSKRVELMLDYFPNADHAGIYAAQAGGHFEQAGLDVEIRQPPDPAAPIKQVAAGRVDLAISYEPEVLRARDQGLAVVSVGALVQEPLTSIISLPKAKIRQPADLAGQDRRHGGDRLPVRLPRDDPARGRRERRLREGTQRRLQPRPALLTGKVDATLGAFWNYEGTQLRLEGKKPADHPHGARRASRPTTSSSWWRTRTRSSATSGKLRAFIGALSRGTRDLRANPGQAIDGLLEANPDLDPELQRAVVEGDPAALLPARGPALRLAGPGRVGRLRRLDEGAQPAREPTDPKASYDNGLLPGAGL